MSDDGAVEFIRPGLSLQAFACIFIYNYYRLAYRVRAWGRLPVPRGPTLLIANHQHDLDDKVTVSYCELGGPLNKPIYAIAGRRLFDPGFLGYTLRWLEWLMRGVDTSRLFLALGMVPIENHLRKRSMMGFARALYDRYGDLPLTQVFREEALEWLGQRTPGQPLSSLFEAKYGRASFKREISIKSIREPYRSELIAAMRASIAASLIELEDLLKRGETLWLTPEGQFTKNGRMNELRTALRRFAPLAQSVFLVAISYDVFVGRRLSMLFRVVPPADPGDLNTSLRAARPVTVSQLLANYLIDLFDRTFTEAEALTAVRDRLAVLPQPAWIDPELRRSPERMTRAALAGMKRLGMLERSPAGYALTRARAHPQFPLVNDIVAFQAAMFEESRAAWERLDAG